ncbi:protein of unknown function [Azospirillum baldaniorum]|uniref:Uncharacterized protein n=1 Tax=Azospirillum baldaniorum TaxID=1064539 RepID=A0A9P1NLI9_9PROT|nr:protein of unknown function [Azospirillum baldaniorum]
MPNTDENRLGGRIARYARVGTAVGGLAARFAGERVAGASPLERGSPRPPNCAPALGGLKGPLMKVAQLLSTIPDALPPRVCAGAVAAPGRRAVDGLALRQAPHGERAGPRLAQALPAL